MDYPQSSIISHQSSIQKGFTLVECLIGLAISAMLLTAMAVAFSASVTNYHENESMYWTMNNARQALARMTSQIRTANPEFGAVDPLAPVTRCDLHTAANEDITYEFRAADQKLYLILNATNQQYVLCDNVIAARFDKTPTEDGTDSKSVQISLTVQEGDFRRTLAAAAVVRKNLGS